MRKSLVVALPMAAVAVVAGLGIAVASQGADAGDAAADSSGAMSGAPTAPVDAGGSGQASASAPASAAGSATPTATPSPTTGAAPSATPGGAPVQVVLGYAGWEPNGTVEVGGFVSSAVEAGGTCTVTLTQGGRQVEVAGPAKPDATTTNCGSLTVPGERLTPGDWEATLSYRSSASHGASEPATVTVPAR